MNNRIEELEIKVSFQEEALNTLNNVIIEQQKRIEELEAIVTDLAEKVASKQSLFDELEQPEPPPPHY